MIKTFDIAVVGGGAAGTMAAIKASSLARSVILLEGNDSLGKKIILTGGGRCNLTNIDSMDNFIKKFKPKGEFLRTAFFSFSNEELIDFFRNHGLELKVEKAGKVYPVTNKASSIVAVLKKALQENKVEIIYNKRISKILKENNIFVLFFQDEILVKARKVIIATGGGSYPQTGSRGDGLKFAFSFGHKVEPLKPALVALKVDTFWLKDLKGVALDRVKISFLSNNKKYISELGEILFTHFGLSGPLILDYSQEIIANFKENKVFELEIDLLPDFTKEQLEKKILKQSSIKGNIEIQTFINNFLPKSLTLVILSIINISYHKRLNQITKLERVALIKTLKVFPIKVIGSLPLELGMITAGGISLKEINPRTLESKNVSGLYFAGEIIEGRGPSGGYNLQQAFSTGYLAGLKAAERN